MDLQKDIKKLVTYGLDKKLIMPEDEIYTINQYLEVFRLDEYEDPDICLLYTSDAADEL